MIHKEKPFTKMTIEEISDELAESYTGALADPLTWANDQADFGVFGRAAAAIHNLLQAMHTLRYGDGDAPWEKAEADTEADSTESPQ